MDRRAFVALLTGGAVGLVSFDLDRLLWVPGAKAIFLPPVSAMTVFDPVSGIRMRLVTEYAPGRWSLDAFYGARVILPQLAGDA